MKRPRIPQALRKRVAHWAKHRCAYCQSAEAVIGATFELDHIIPFSLGGATEEANLCLACSECNDHKLNRVLAIDPQTEVAVSLFNPRTQVWTDHFCWRPDGSQVHGLTPTGRATVAALQLNRPKLVASRYLWVAAGWHPPKD
jgi:hypothetical protein